MCRNDSGLKSEQDFPFSWIFRLNASDPYISITVFVKVSVGRQTDECAAARGAHKV
jgi:hypothetical protein